MADLTSGHYPNFNPLMALYGQLSNVAQPDVPARSNLELPIGNLADGALAASGVLAAVPIPVDWGTTISAVTLLTGATAASGPTHQFAAIYSGIGTPALLAQSADGLTAAIAAKTAITYTLQSPQTILQAQAPNGFIYAGVAITVGTTMPTAVTLAAPAGINYQWNSNGPVFLSLSAGSALAGTAAATIASPAALATAPVLRLT